MPSLKYFPHDEAVRELADLFVKIPVNPPLQTEDDNGFSPLVKGRCEKIDFHGGRAGILAGRCPVSPRPGGAKGHNKNEISFPGSPRPVAGELHKVLERYLFIDNC
jgi:hypothetical protein